MPVNTFYKTSVDVTITLTNGTPTSLSVPAVLDNVALTELKDRAATRGGREDVVIQSRGTLLQVREGARTFPNLSFEAYLPGMTSATAGLLRDFIAFENAYSAGVGTMSTAAGCPRTLNCAIAVEGSDHGDVDETITITNWRITFGIATAIDGNKISLQGPVYGTVTHA